MAQKYWSRMGNRLPATNNATCVVCGDGFHVKPSVAAKGKGKFCSRDCYAAHLRTVRGDAHPAFGVTRSQGTERVCKGCGETFVHRRSKVEYCSVACHHRANPRKPTAGNRSVTAQGYIRLTLADGRRVLEHRWVWEQANGPIPAGALIHHRNEVKTDNRLENLKLVGSVSEHNLEHGGTLRDSYPARRMAECHPDRPNRGRGLCLSCYMKDRRGTLGR